MKRILIAPVRFYQRFISPAFPPSCRFEPTCSNYMIQAIEKHGFKGVLMGLARILRCHPWSKTGKDPVPDHFSLKRNHKQKESAWFFFVYSRKEVGRLRFPLSFSSKKW